MTKNLQFTFVLLVSLLTFNSCDKQKRAGKKLSGDWEIVEFRKTDWEGMTEYAAPLTGTLTFDEYSGDSSTYTMDIAAEFTSSYGNIQQNGAYKITDKGNYMNVSTLDPQGALTSYYQYRILTLNSTDLQLEFTNSDGYYHMMIFKKK